MADKSKIEWTDATWNPATGCTKVSPGCANCYAERMTKRMGSRVHGTISPSWDGNEVIEEREARFDEVVIHMSRIDQPLHWRKPRMIFVCSMGDLFHKDISNGFILDVFGTIATCPQHTFLILTKRAERMMLFCQSARPPKNVWLGVSAENQKTADERIPLLLQTPSKKRFVSCEPMLGEISLFDISPNAAPTINVLTGSHNCASDYAAKLDWVICGGESGPKARRMYPEWARKIRDQCWATDVPFFFKQWGEYNTTGQRVGKKIAGSMLDGKEHKEVPE